MFSHLNPKWPWARPVTPAGSSGAGKGQKTRPGVLPYPGLLISIGFPTVLSRSSWACVMFTMEQFLGVWHLPDRGLLTGPSSHVCVVRHA